MGKSRDGDGDGDIIETQTRSTKCPSSLYYQPVTN